MLVLRVLLILCSIFCLSYSQKSDRECKAEGGKCIRWDRCAPVAAILRRNPPVVSELLFAQKFLCRYKKGIPFYCCIPGMTAETDLPQPQNPVTLKPSDEETGIEPHPLDNHPKRDLLPMSKCGQTQKDLIVGGRQALLGEFPWLAIVHYSHRRKAGMFGCGGSLINKRYVLTAAHCLHPDKLDGYYPDAVRLGEYDLNTDPDIQYGQEGRRIVADPVMEFMIEAKIIHEDYIAYIASQYHDIGLIRLNRDAPTTKYVKPICLPSPEVDKDIISRQEEHLQVAGWGNTESGSRSTVLLTVALKLVDTNTCAARYDLLGRNVTSAQLCAGSEGKDSCGGDSGGPLMGVGSYSQYRNMRYFAVGLVSYGHTSCGTKGVPGVYTRVKPYVSWILDNMEP